MRTRMSGGVGGAEPRGFPLSRSMRISSTDTISKRSRSPVTIRLALPFFAHSKDYVVFGIATALFCPVDFHVDRGREVQVADAQAFQPVRCRTCARKHQLSQPRFHGK